MVHDNGDPALLSISFSKRQFSRTQSLAEQS